jgi:hypothetical protein
LYGSGGIKKRYSSSATLEFDLTAARKSWLHLFPDFFEGYNYLQTFPFGKKSNYPEIHHHKYLRHQRWFRAGYMGNYFQWLCIQAGWVHLTNNSQSDLQQGLGLLFGTTRFEYPCTK